MVVPEIVVNMSDKFRFEVYRNFGEVTYVCAPGRPNSADAP